MFAMKKLCAAVLAAATLAGCATAPATRAPAAAPAGPGTLPQRNVTDFTAALRCMDETLYAFGTRDIAVIVEELRDESRRLGAGTRDMMISAVSEMTRRSRAIRLVTFGNDNQNVQFLLQQLEKRTPFGILPQYDIRGSVTQFDEDIERRESGFGAGGLLRQLVGFRVGGTSTVNVLGFDASVVTVPELTLLPGATSKNTVVVTRDERSVADGQALIQKVGLSFSMSVSRNAGVAQALRNMIELSAVELVGKMTRVPYWGCLGLSADHPEVKREIEDWFLSLHDEADRVRFLQEQLRFRKFYDGPADGRAHPAFNQALAAYRQGLGQGLGQALGQHPAADAVVDLAFFTAFLTRPVPKAPAQPFSTGPLPAAAAGAVAATTAAAAPAAQAAPVAKAVVAVVPVQSPQRVGQAIEVAVQANQSGYVYCYVQTAAGNIQRVYPNRQVRDPRLEADQMLMLPADGGFKLQADKPGAWKLACLLAPREVYNDLPPPARWGDFEDVRLKSFAEIRDAFQKAGGQPVVMDELAWQVAP